MKNTTVSFGDRIRAKREAIYPSQEAAARVAEVALNTWARWERDAALPELDSLPKIAKALKITVAELMQE